MEQERKRLEKIVLASMDSSESLSDVASPLHTYHPYKVKFLQEKLTKVLPKKKATEILRVSATSSVKEAAKVSF